MVDWHDIKKAFERDAQKAEATFMDREQQLLKSITVYLCGKKGVSPIQGYEPDEALGFLQKPVAEIKDCLGGEWAAFEDEKLETLAYSLTKKVQKSGKIINWDNK